MNTQPLDYQIPSDSLRHRTLPNWRDLLQTWPGVFVGLLLGVGLSMLYFAPRGTEWLPLYLGGFKFFIGTALTITDRCRWIGLGLLVSIPVGVVICLAAIFGNGWCC